VDYQEHYWHYVPALTFQLSGQAVFCGTNGNMNVIVYQVHSQLIQRENRMFYCLCKSHLSGCNLFKVCLKKNSVLIFFNKQKLVSYKICDLKNCLYLATFFKLW
jgi:hypothetical protein